MATGEGTPAPPEATGAGAGARRNRAIRLAVATSFLSKAGTALMQFVAIPIAVRVLGRAEFGLFTSVSLTLTTMSLLEIGIGPALTHGISRASARNDQTTEGTLASTAWFLMVGLALLAGLALATVLMAVPLPAIYGQEFAGKEGAMRPALWLGLFLFLSMFLLNLTERLREGYLEVHANNLWGALGNIVAVTAVACGVWRFPYVWYLVLSVHGALVLGKLSNTIALWGRRPLVIPRWCRFDRSTARHLFTDGLAYSSCFLVTGVIENNLCGLFAARSGGPAAVALYGVFISLTVAQLGFVIMISTPTWPAVAEALARGDTAWARTAARRLYRYGTAFSLCTGLGLVAVGPWFFSLWLGKEFASTDRVVLACYAFYFLAHTWRHLNHALMLGTGQVKKMARVQFAESAVLAVVAWAAMRWGGLPAMLGAMGATILALTGWILPRLVARALPAR